MNDTIASIIYADRNKKSLEIWLMSESHNNVGWDKQPTIEFGGNMYKHDSRKPVLGRHMKELWLPAGIWIQDGHYHLLVVPYADCDDSIYLLDSDDTVFRWDELGHVPYLISVNLETQAEKIIYLTQVTKSVNIVSTPTGYDQIYTELDIEDPEWFELKTTATDDFFARFYHGSLNFI
ncbi:unnamed protein product [Cuscuta epithymum]|uniref:F-box associated domain-containing protein n=1 Tax=Cuscuta epithymum TaxID=186058 RepID=A0AAV0ETD8_9ASTE|nr:unnamed protein product [Cuscuta epithymum]